MVIQNLIAGSDRLGKELRCGDICSFQMRMNEKGKQKAKNMRGIIVYEPSWYSHMFVTLDDVITEILMSAVEMDTIEYEVSIKGDGFVYRNGDGGTRDATYCSFEESLKWHTLYRKHLEG